MAEERRDEQPGDTAVDNRVRKSFDIRAYLPPWLGGYAKSAADTPRKSTVRSKEMGTTASGIGGIWPPSKPLHYAILAGGAVVALVILYFVISALGSLFGGGGGASPTAQPTAAATPAPALAATAPSAGAQFNGEAFDGFRLTPEQKVDVQRDGGSLFILIGKGDGFDMVLGSNTTRVPAGDLTVDGVKIGTVAVEPEGVRLKFAPGANTKVYLYGVTHADGMVTFFQRSNGTDYVFGLRAVDGKLDFVYGNLAANDLTPGSSDPVTGGNLTFGLDQAHYLVTAVEGDNKVSITFVDAAAPASLVAPVVPAATAAPTQ